MGAKLRPYKWREDQQRGTEMWFAGGVQFRLNVCKADGYCENHEHFFDHITTVYHDFMLLRGDEDEWRLLPAGSSEFIPRWVTHTFKPVPNDGVDEYKFVCSWLLDWEKVSRVRP